MRFDGDVDPFPDKTCEMHIHWREWWVSHKLLALQSPQIGRDCDLNKKGN